MRRIDSYSPPGAICLFDLVRKLPEQFVRLPPKRTPSRGSSSFRVSGTSGYGVSMMLSMRSLYCCRTCAASGGEALCIRLPIRLSGAHARIRDMKPCLVSSSSLRAVAATSGCTMRCIPTRRPQRITVSVARTRLIGSPSHAADNPVMVRSLDSSVMPWPPMNCPPSEPMIPYSGCPRLRQWTRPSNVKSLAMMRAIERLLRFGTELLEFFLVRFGAGRAGFFELLFDGLALRLPHLVAHVVVFHRHFVAAWSCCSCCFCGAKA